MAPAAAGIALLKLSSVQHFDFVNLQGTIRL